MGEGWVGVEHDEELQVGGASTPPHQGGGLKLAPMLSAPLLQTDLQLGRPPAQAHIVVAKARGCRSSLPLQLPIISREGAKEKEAPRREGARAETRRRRDTGAAASRRA